MENTSYSINEYNNKLVLNQYDYNNVKITLTDINGRIIQFRNTLNGRFFDLEIDSSSGMYLLTVESGKNRAVIKIIKN